MNDNKTPQLTPLYDRLQTVEHSVAILEKRPSFDSEKIQKYVHYFFSSNLSKIEQSFGELGSKLISTEHNLELLVGSFNVIQKVVNDQLNGKLKTIKRSYYSDEGELIEGEIVDLDWYLQKTKACFFDFFGFVGLFVYGKISGLDKTDQLTAKLFFEKHLKDFSENYKHYLDQLVGEIYFVIDGENREVYCLSGSQDGVKYEHLGSELPELGEDSCAVFLVATDFQDCLETPPIASKVFNEGGMMFKGNLDVLGRLKNIAEIGEENKGEN